ncbi:MAG: DUF3822 family protein [Ferruginibacter sp.]|nr:DUF3822 family protein [Ferruginibacter sp.]
MKLSFHIQPVNIDTTNADLFFEISAQGLSYIIIDNGICLAMVIYNFSEGTSDEAAVGYVHQVMADQPVLHQRFNKVHIIYGYAPSVLVPHQFMNDADSNAMLELVFGEASERVTRTDFMYRHAIHNVYAVPAVIEQVVTRYFGSADYTHQASLLPDVVKSAGNHLYCIFGTGRLKTLLLKEGKLQLMQNYWYKTAEDVSYQLLNQCKSFDMDTNEILVQLSGMIDASSGLYNELYKYFLQVQFEPLPVQYQYPEAINQYPPHYFSHLFAIAACV